LFSHAGRYDLSIIDDIRDGRNQVVAHFIRTVANINGESVAELTTGSSTPTEHVSISQHRTVVF
jgi:hypothetical protein